MARLIVPSRKVSPEITTAPTQPAPVAGAGKQIAQALEIVGKTVSEAGRTGVQIAEAEKREAERLEKVALREKSVKDKTAIANGKTLFQNTMNKLELELNANLGLTATGNTAKRKAQSATTFNKIMEGFENDEQKIEFQEWYNIHEINANHSTAVKEQDQINKGRVNSFEAGGTTAVQAGIRDFKNPNTHAISEDQIEDYAIGMQEVLRWTPQEKQNWINKHKSNMYEEIVKLWAIEDAEIARLSFETNKDKIDPTKHDDLENTLKVNDTNQKAKDASDEILAKDLTEKESLEQANKIKDADISAKASSNIRTSFADKRRFEARDRLILNDKQTGDIDDMLNNPNQSFEGIVEYINGIENKTDRRAQMSYFKSELKKKDTDIETDNEKLTEIQGKINRGEYETMTEMRRDASPVTSKEDMKSLETLYQNGGTLGGLKDTEVVKQYKLFTGKEPFGKKNSNQYQFFRKYIEDNVKALDRKLTQTDLSKWGAEALIQLQAEGEKLGGGLGFGADVTYGEAFEEGIDVARDWLPDITGEDIVIITPILRNEGIRPTEKNIRIYKKYEILGIPLEEETQ